LNPTLAGKVLSCSMQWGKAGLDQLDTKYSTQAALSVPEQKLLGAKASFDFVLASDVVYDRKAIPLLFYTVNWFLSKGQTPESKPTFFLCYTSRFLTDTLQQEADELILKEAASCGLSVVAIDGIDELVRRSQRILAGHDKMDQPKLLAFHHL